MVVTFWQGMLTSEGQDTRDLVCSNHSNPWSYKVEFELLTDVNYTSMNKKLNIFWKETKGMTFDISLSGSPSSICHSLDPSSPSVSFPVF